MGALEFKKAVWIWENGFPMQDEFSEMRETFISKGTGKYYLNISADSDYAVYINGELALFGQYADYPDCKTGDRSDITGFIRRGENTLSVIVWFYGKGSSTYTPGNAGVIYELTCGGNVVCFSSEDTLSRPALGYVPHKAKLITGQLGLTYEYDSRISDVPFSKSFALSGLRGVINARPIKKTEMKERTSFKKAFAGTYEFYGASEGLGVDMSRAALTFIRGKEGKEVNKPFSVVSDKGRNVYFISDIGEEQCGFLDFDIEVSEECDVFIAYGEHINDGRVRTYKRNFTVIYHAQKGRNSFLGALRRLGCRYLQFFVGCTEVKVNYAGIRPVEYPLYVNNLHTGNLLRDTITDVSVRTLRLCMHEHYEDCPWREQSLYTMDSRNQALCGYIAFNEYEFPRASFALMSKKLRPDGLLYLCAPGDTDITIPSFSCAYFIEMEEYIKYSGDISLAEECCDTMRALMNVFLSHKKENGLYINFYQSEGSPYWGFYEWAPTLNGVFGEKNPSFECPMNAFLSIALKSFSAICEKLGKISESEAYRRLSDELNIKIAECFYNENDKLFISFLEHDREKYSVLVNSLCVLCGAAENLDVSVIDKILLSNSEADTGLCVIPCTLSMNIYRFDALLKLNSNYSEKILNEIDRTYLYMLRHEATAFWETLKGEDDFDGVGSLCHGWSALPIYYYNILK